MSFSVSLHCTTLNNVGSYPPPKDGYGKYASYGKYGATKRDAEAEANPDGYGKYANYGMRAPQ